LNEEFKFQISGTAELLTFSEIDRLLKDMMQDEIDRIERRLVEVFDRREERPASGRNPAEDHYGSIGKMKLADALIKFK